ncbi:hypothetical protein MA16_Dca001370 [Dendrobium catenatum]|uniref:Uncharacterized protein n=1 Tax=Dendrobium catenatum TaxID=906689 RepID=A0A2I0WM78_9ASPA|nr:hypothetical protein MA16_Dca001370 [Dendrobium catenatum]
MEYVSLHPYLAKELTIIHKPTTVVAKETSWLTPVVDAHDLSTSHVVVVDVGYAMVVSPTLVSISIDPDVSLNLFVSVNDVGDHIIEHEKHYYPMDVYGYSDVSNKDPIINIFCSPLSDDALVSLG